MRRVLAITSLAAILAVASGSGALILDAAQDLKDIILRGLDPNKPVSVRTATATSQATTGGAGDLSIALDPTKSYTVYKRECSRYEIVEQSIDNQECENNRQADQTTNGDCPSCEVVGLIVNGAFQPRTAQTNFFRTPLGLGATIGGAAGAIALGTMVGGDSNNTNTNNPGNNNSGNSGGSSGLALTTFVNRIFQASLGIAANSCNLNFSNPATIRVQILTVTPDASGNTATITVTIVHVLVNTTFSGSGRLTRNSNGTFAFTADQATAAGFNSTGQGTINTAGNQMTGFLNRLTNTANCMVDYSGTLNQS